MLSVLKLKIITITRKAKTRSSIKPQHGKGDKNGQSFDQQLIHAKTEKKRILTLTDCFSAKIKKSGKKMFCLAQAFTFSQL